MTVVAVVMVSLVFVLVRAGMRMGVRQLAVAV
jgi:hypothetical protein